MTKRISIIKRDFSWALQKAVYTKLQSAVILTMVPSGVGTPVLIKDFMGVPKETPFPYATIGDETTERAMDTKSSSSEEITCQIHVWSQYQGTQEARYIGNQIELALTSEPLDLSADGFLLTAFRKEFAQTLKEIDGLTSHRVIRFRAWMEDVQTIQPVN